MPMWTKNRRATRAREWTLNRCRMRWNCKGTGKRGAQQVSANRSENKNRVYMLECCGKLLLQCDEGRLFGVLTAMPLMRLYSLRKRWPLLKSPCAVIVELQTQE
jgi:hypothetical protein